MAINYKLGGDDPKPLKAPGAIKRIFTNKDKSKFDSGEKNEYLDTKNKKYSVKTGNMYQKDTGKTTTSRYEISPAVKGTPEVKGTSTYKPELAATTNSKFGNTSPERQKQAQKEQEGKNTPFQSALRKAQEEKKDTFDYADKRGKLSYKSGTTTTTPDTPGTPDKEAVYGEKKTKIYESTPEIKTASYGQGDKLPSKKVPNVKDMFKAGYDNKPKRNILNNGK